MGGDGHTLVELGVLAVIGHDGFEECRTIDSEAEFLF